MPLASGHSRGIIGSNIREMMAAGHPQAQAIAAALSSARHLSHASGGIVGYDTGGVSPMGIAPQTGYMPTSPATANPTQQIATQRYEQLPTEKLHELAMQFGGTPQGQMIQRILQAREMAPNAGIAGAQQPTYAAGGYADGGGAESFGEAASMARHVGHTTTGFLHSAVPGRTDLIHAAPPVGAFVIPADIVSGIGQGNSNAGAFLLQHALGAPFKLQGGGMRMPAAPPRFTEPLQGPTAKRGGRAKGDERIGDPTPILAAGGEFIVSPEAVRRVGGGDYKRGHDALDAWVIKKRKEIIKTMRGLKPPKKG